jgi:hypothetical protein
MSYDLACSHRVGTCTYVSKHLDPLEIHFRGALINNHFNGTFYDSAAYRPLFAKAQELDVPSTFIQLLQQTNGSLIIVVIFQNLRHR